MCIARVGKIVGLANGRATVEFFDGRALDEVDLSVVKAKVGSYVEVFGNMALLVLSAAEARSRKRVWSEVKAAAGGVPL